MIWVIKGVGAALVFLRSQASLQSSFVALWILLIAGSTGSAAGGNVAFVVGVNKYSGLGKQAQLTNPVRDASAVRDVLKNDLQYDVIYGEDVDRATFQKLWLQFLGKIGSSSKVVVYLTGHGVEIENVSYFSPGDLPFIDYNRRRNLIGSAINIADLLSDVADREANAALVAIDACRDDPFIPAEYRKGGTASGGLGQLTPTKGMIVVQSASPGKVAYDRLPGETEIAGHHSLFARYFVPALKHKNQDVLELLRKMKFDIIDKAALSGIEQIPTVTDLLRNPFCLDTCKIDAAPENKPAVVVEPPKLPPVAAPGPPILAQEPSEEQRRAATETAKIAEQKRLDEQAAAEIEAKRRLAVKKAAADVAAVKKAQEEARSKPAVKATASIQTSQPAKDTKQSDQQKNSGKAVSALIPKIAGSSHHGLRSNNPEYINMTRCESYDPLGQGAYCRLNNGKVCVSYYTDGKSPRTLVDCR